MARPAQCRPIDVGRGASAVDQDEAREIANQAIRKSLVAPVLHAEEARAYGWLFHFVPKRFAESRDPNDAIPGIGPIAVHAVDGVACMLNGNPMSLEHYEQQWRRLNGL